MALIDFILNAVALLLWLSWLPVRFDASTKTSAATLVGTLRKAEQLPPKRWIYLLCLALLLTARTIGYWQICPSLHMNPILNLGLIKLGFRSDSFSRMALFSPLSFLLVILEFYFCLLLLSAANSHLPKNDPFQRTVRGHLGWLESLPSVVKLLLPFFAGAMAWLAANHCFTWLGMLPPTKTSGHLWEQTALMGAATYLSWKYLLVAILLLHLLNSYVYFGNHAFWNFLNATARNVLYPLQWLPLRAGKVDFLPVVVIALVFLGAEAFTAYVRLPF